MQPTPINIATPKNAMAASDARVGLSFLKGRKNAPGDIWGALAAVLVVLPSSIAFGVTVFAAIGASHAALGALAGIIGATVLGLIASTMGGTDRLITAPCAPAAAVLSAFAIELVSKGVQPGAIILMLIILGVLTGLLQMLLGFVKVGSLIRYIPYPVVSGYLTGVGLIIIGSQIPKFFGAPGGTKWWTSLMKPELWNWYSLTIGITTVAVTILAPYLTRRVPGTILGILAGVGVYFGLASQDATLWEINNNPLIVGPLGASSEGYFDSISNRWHEISDLRVGQIVGLIGSALTLAVLLSIDTLKTCVVLDKLTRSHHDSNRELIAQGMANVASSAVGGMPGAGQMGATMVALTSGAQTRAAGVIEGVFALVASLLLSTILAWVPVATLAGVLIVIGFRMIDKDPIRFIESRATVFDFAVVFAVVITALMVGLIAASATGVGLAILMFVREQIGSSVIRHRIYVNQMSSTWYRPAADVRILEEKGNQGVIFELQGSLFFGNTQQLWIDLEHEITSRSYIIIDMKRVTSIDVTAAHLLNHIRDAIVERGAVLAISNLRENLPNGRNLREFLEQTGLLEDGDDRVKLFLDLDTAIAWVENQILGERATEPTEDEPPITLQEMEIFANHKDETLKDLETCLQPRSYKEGDALYSTGEPGDAIYWIRRGTVRIVQPIGAGRTRHIATFGRGDFFGGLTFLDRRTRTNDAIADVDTDVYVLTREQFNHLAEEHKRLAFNLVMALAATLASRLRHAETEITMLQEY